MRLLRCLIDSMIFDAIADEPGLLALVDRLTSAGRLELLAAPVSVDQVAATPDPVRRKLLRRVRVLVVPPVEPGDAVGGAELAALWASPGVDLDDAGIAAAAFVQHAPFVTEDRDLRRAVAERLPGLPVWGWASDLRPRLVALGTSD